MTTAPLDITDLGVDLGGVPVLRQVSMRVDAGEFVALLGGNGSGKTTLVRAALGLLAHQRGAITLFGEDQARFRDWPRIGYVPQRGNVTHMKASVREVVGAGRLARRKLFRLLDADGRRIVDESLARVGLTERGSDEVAHLSGGQQQRVLIARALATQPDLMVLDEPLAGVDLATQQTLADLIGRLNADGMAVLIVLHELGAFAALLDRGVLLADGRVVADGPVGDLELHPGVHEWQPDEPRRLAPDTLGGDA